MKYKIIIEGGFSGISRKYEGEIEVSGSETQKLLSALNTKYTSRFNIPDGQTYHILLEEDTKKHQAVFNEKNVPEEIRKLIAKAKQKNRQLP